MSILRQLRPLWLIFFVSTVVLAQEPSGSPSGSSFPSGSFVPSGAPSVTITASPVAPTAAPVAPITAAPVTMAPIVTPSPTPGIFVFYPSCNMCVRGEFDEAKKDEFILSIPFLNFYITCNEANFGGLVGLLAPQFCTGIQAVGSSGACGCDKASWPETVGFYSGEDAKQLIESETPGVTGIIILSGTPVTDDFDEDRVRIFVDNDGFVDEPPTVG
mmetsp:Transcript_5804/g.9644  ORF Transcript_5804/g.9644 Transcript_5804/m.9644 type:complete len:216 (+) Transcript_5804:61-708(+)|eukprot:CAMPEP_0119002762 /NCGR_PEP_ID=MMETSP1176-20130426/108_1 /TAXON_ID=265551 /ORGANISM="Synedropsis recta cf, Strain CCMP1620" /LENGTH=215 /DNA_ID=CAMNT_0006954285 /DNA_START=61 /DNA_END=708 /DNA_ORIENTATION=+